MMREQSSGTSWSIWRRHVRENKEETGMNNNCDIITRINQKYSGMSKGHKKIASYIMEHYDQAAFMTAARLGEELQVSESTVVRFAAGIGYEGYPGGACLLGEE